MRQIILNGIFGGIIGLVCSLIYKEHPMCVFGIVIAFWGCMINSLMRGRDA